MNPAAPSATEKSCKQGAAWPRENAPISNDVNTYMYNDNTPITEHKV